MAYDEQSHQLSQFQRTSLRTRTHLRRQTQNLAPALHPQIRTNNPSNPRPQHLPLIIQQHRRIIVEPHHASVRSPHRLPRAHDHRSPNVPPAHFYRGRGEGCGRGDGTRAFDDADDFVADGAPAVRDFVFEDVDAFDDERAGVVDALGSKAGFRSLIRRRCMEMRERDGRLVFL